MKIDRFSVVAVGLCVILAAFCLFDALNSRSTVTVLTGASAMESAQPTDPTESTAALQSASTATQAPDTSASTSEQGSGALSLVSVTSPVHHGSRATLCVRGEAGVRYSIQVFYSSAASTASGLEPQTADAEGLVQWSWRVGASTKPGEYRIVVSGGDDTLEIKFSVT